MTLLDDYEAVHKLQGVHIVSQMLALIPNRLLNRTGVDSLLYTVFRFPCMPGGKYPYRYTTGPPSTVPQYLPITFEQR